VIGFLRFIGVINAAVWLGAAVFLTVWVGPAIFSDDMKDLLTKTNYPYFSGAIAQIILKRYYHVHLTCGVVAFLHLLAEWLYMGRPARKFSMTLLSALFALALLGGFWLQPKMKDLHAVRYGTRQGVNVTPEEREAARKSFGVWHGVAQLANLFMIGGLVVYVWRTANPSDTLRFVSSVKFRG